MTKPKTTEEKPKYVPRHDADFRFIDEQGRYCRFRSNGEEEYFVEGGRDSGVGNWYSKIDPNKKLPHRDKNGNWTPHG